MNTSLIQYELKALATVRFGHVREKEVISGLRCGLIVIEKGGSVVGYGSAQKLKP
jgi:hypothetical protein